MSSYHSSFEGWLSKSQSPSLGSNLLPRRSIEIVSKPVSDGFLRKFSDVSTYNFDHAQSSNWSPPIVRTAFLDSQASVRAAAPRKMLSISRSSSSLSVKNDYCTSTGVLVLPNTNIVGGGAKPALVESTASLACQ